MKNVLKYGLLAFVGALVLSLGLALTPGVAMAHADVTTPSQWGACSDYWVYSEYEFSITNLADGTVNYEINGQDYTLWEGETWWHSFPRERGYSDCSIESYELPVINFDGTFSSGYWEESFSLGNYDAYQFESFGSFIDLYQADFATPTTFQEYPVGDFLPNFLAYGDAGSGTVSTSVGDYYTFQAWDGDWVEITMSSSNMDTLLELYGPDGRLVASNDDDWGSTDSYIYVDNLQYGTYTIVARGYAGDTGTYWLTLD